MSQRRYIGFLILFVFLQGCALTTWTYLYDREYQDSARKFKAQVSVDWYKFNWTQSFVITKDGILLDRIVVERRKFKDKLEFTKKKYFDDMSLEDLIEIESDNLKSNDKTNKLEIVANEPAKLDNYAAYRLEYTYFTKDNLKVRGLLYGLIADEHVYRIYYEATDQHYFKENKPAFDHFVETFRLL